MYARVTTIEGTPERIEEGARVFREQVMPWLRDSTGFRGLIVLLDRESNHGIGISFWTTEEAASDSDASGATLRDEVVASVGTTLTSEKLYEVVVTEALALDER